MDLLKRIIKAYRSMSVIDVDVVVFSEAPKNLGNQAEVIVGLPTKNPWTLPFAHKPVFAQRVDQYDLFIYSEDDIGVSEANITAFLKATPLLATDEIAGFFRYEINSSGKWFLDEPWGHYHWKPESVRRRGPYTVAEFTNEHAGFYVLTQAQLKQAIASKGYLRPPRRGRYGFPETAATDVYTQCGFSKVFCVNALDDFLVQHLSNKYVGLLDVSLDDFRIQLQTLVEIGDGAHPATTFCQVESARLPTLFQKSYYEKPVETLLALVPAAARSALSVGCGWGATEAKLQSKGLQVTALPLDSVIGAVASRRGVEVVYGDWDGAFQSLEGRKFDCLLLTNLLHLRSDPEQAVQRCSRFLRKGGTLLLQGPNFRRAPWLAKRGLDLEEFGKLGPFERCGMSLCGPNSLKKSLRSAGLKVTACQWLNHRTDIGRIAWKYPLGKVTARDWVLRAEL